MFITITDKLTTQQLELPQGSYNRRKGHQSDWSDASLSNLFNNLNIPFKGCSYQEWYIWIIRLVKSRFRIRFMPIGWRQSTSQSNHNVPSCFRAIFVPFLIKKRHFSQVFVPHILIFKKLHLLLLSKMEVQAENGAKNH